MRTETNPSNPEYDSNSGAFGEYLMSPISAKDRLAVVARNMAICRKAAGMSQRDVCNVIGCAPQTYSGYEKGKHEPTIETLVRLSHLYDVSLDFLSGKYVHDTEFSSQERNENLDENIRFVEIMSRLEKLEKQLDQR